MIISTLTAEELGLGSLTELADASLRTTYRQAFCDIFSDVAPESWSRLIALDPLAQLTANPIGTQPPTAQRHLDAAIQQWAIDAHIPVPWVVAIARLTLSARQICRMSGVREPETLAFLSFDLESNVLTVRQTKEWRSFVDIKLDVSVSDLHWDPTKESRAQFRNRATKLFKDELNQAIDDIGEPVPSFALTTDPARDARWFIQRVVLGIGYSTIKGQNGHAGDTRKSIREAVAKASGALGIPLPMGD